MSEPSQYPGQANYPDADPHPGRDGHNRAAASADDRATASTIVLDHDEIARTITRMAHEILETNRGAADLVLLGIPTRGVPLAERLAAAIAAVEGDPPPLGQLDITMYRDDLRSQPTRSIGPTSIPRTLDAATVVLVDDVLFSGRTVAAALDALKDLGRPRAVRLAVLIDRGHRQLPIRADYVGKNLPTAVAERVVVRLSESDQRTEVAIEGGSGNGEPDDGDSNGGGAQ